MRPSNSSHKNLTYMACQNIPVGWGQAWTNAQRMRPSTSNYSKDKAKHFKIKTNQFRIEKRNDIPNPSSLNLEPTNIHFPIFADRVEWLGWASRLWDLISNDSPSGWLVRMCLQYLRPEEWHLQWQSVSVVRHPNTSHTHSIHWIDSQQRIDDDDDDQQINLQEESFKKQTNQPTQTCPIQTRKEDKSWAKMMDGFPVQII
jgi:hypothetical protein